MPMTARVHIDNPLQKKSPPNLMKKVKKSTAEYNRYHFTKEIMKCNIDPVDFGPCSFSAQVSVQKLLSCDNIQTMLGKTIMSKCNIPFFEITLPPHSCLFGNFAIIFGGCSW